jgi:DNA repair protein RadC
MKDLNKNSTSIKNWAIDDRPREKLAQKGTSSLSNAELLAILINTGTTTLSALDIAKNILQSCNNNLYELHKWQLHNFMEIKGIGQAKAIKIMAALELGKRRHLEQFEHKSKLNNPESTAAFLKTILQNEIKEHFVVVFLNSALFYITHEIISQGGLSQTVADIKVIFKKALMHNAQAIILCHNHPSGNLNPSNADIKLTEKIVASAATLDISVIDHFIVSESGFYSFSKNGLM